MEISIKSIALFSAILLTGLSAGLFYAWAVSVIPGTQKVSDLTYLETMQAINRAILNPAFFAVFFGSQILLIVSAVQHYQNGMPFWILLAAMLTYLIGTVGVTVFGNIPLNYALDLLDIGETAEDRLAEFRQHYEFKWNRLNLIRTCFALLSFLLSLLAFFTNSKTI